MGNDNEKSAQIRPLNLGHYLREDMYRKMIQIVAENNPLRDIDEALFCILAECFCNDHSNHASGMMAVYFSLNDNPEGATYTTTIQNVDRVM